MGEGKVGRGPGCHGTWGGGAGGIQLLGLREEGAGILDLGGLREEGVGDWIPGSRGGCGRSGGSWAQVQE